MRVVLLLVVASGCQVASLQPDGPAVDFTGRVDEVAAVFAGTRTGAVEDGGGEYPCGMEGAAFTVVSDVSAPIACSDHVDSTVDTCASATDASFPLEGSIEFADDEPIAVSGHIGIWSEPEGLMLFKSVLEPTDDSDLAMELLVDGTLLDEAVFTGLHWTDRHSEEGDEATIWEICTFTFAD